MKDVLSAVATNLHVVVISLLIIGLDLGVVRIGSNRTDNTGHPPASITLSTTSDSRGSHSGTGHHVPSVPSVGAILPGGDPAEPWRPPVGRWPARP
jgi:hypothetical protein